MTVGSSGGRWVALAMVAAAGTGTGCGGANEQCARPVQLSAELRRERHTIHNLENEIILLRAQLRDRAPVPPGPPPEAAIAVASAPPSEGAPGEAISAGYADTPYGEVEVVYEGEAARESKVRPRIEIHETTRVASARSSDKAATPVTAVPRPAIAPLPETGDERLPVVPGRIPTVAEQLRRARAVTPEGGVVATIRPAASLVPRAPGARVITVPAPVGVADSAGPSIEDRTASIASVLPVATVSPASDQDAEEVESAKVLYRRGKGALRAGKQERAVRSLRSFLEHYPRHYLADNVQFYLAESFYRRDRHADALVEYNRLVVRYWRGNKLPDALLKIALCELALGRHETGVASLRRLVSRFPQTRPARAARARLAELARP